MTACIKCKKHPTYQAKRAPRSQCRDCWLRWTVKQNDLLRSRISHLERRRDLEHQDWI